MVTQKNIAKRLGISPSLVSRALSGTAVNIGASEETVRRIREEAQRLNYAPNAAAQTLRGAKSMTLGVVIKDFEDPFFGSMIGRLQELAREKGVSLLLSGIPASLDGQGELASLLRYQLDGLVICGSDVCAPWIRAFIKKGLPIAQIGEGRAYPGVSRVEMDEEHGISLVLDHLTALAHDKIAFIGDQSSPHKTRRLIFKKLLAEKGLATNPGLLISVEAGFNAGELAMTALFARAGQDLPTAVLAADDIMAMGAMRSIQTKGLSIPHDISLCGIDDIPASALLSPALTTLKSPIDKMVRAAFKLVVEDAVRGEDATVLRFKSELVKRESCV